MRYPLLLSATSLFAFVYLVANTALDRLSAEEISVLAEGKRRTDDANTTDEWLVHFGLVGDGVFFGWTEITELSFPPDDLAG